MSHSCLRFRNGPQNTLRSMLCTAEIHIHENCWLGSFKKCVFIVFMMIFLTRSFFSFSSKSTAQKCVLFASSLYRNKLQ